jgi:hypothetical protein
VVHNFIPESLIASLVQEAFDNEKDAFVSTETHTAYQLESDCSLPPSHPRNTIIQSRKRIVDYERIPENSCLKALYEDPQMTEFVKRVVGLADLHPSACPFNAGYYNIFRPGDGLGWHFDHSDFGVNLVLQQPEVGGGGEFQFHHNTREGGNRSSSNQEPSITSSYLAVGEILESGANASVLPPVSVVHDITVGSLVIFAGRWSLHRVAPVSAGERVNVIFTYETNPDAGVDEYSLKKFFGRTVAEADAAMAKSRGE